MSWVKILEKALFLSWKICNFWSWYEHIAWFHPVLHMRCKLLFPECHNGS